MQFSCCDTFIWGSEIFLEPLDAQQLQMKADASNESFWHLILVIAADGLSLISVIHWGAKNKALDRFKVLDEKQIASSNSCHM